MNSHWTAYGILYGSAFIVAVSQVCLKWGASRPYRIAPFVNIWIITGYVLVLSALVLNIVGLKHVPLKHMAFVLPATYIFVSVLSRIVFKESFTGRKCWGILLIIAGTVVFNL